MISMLPHRTAGTPVPSCSHGPPWSERVRGLGVCDALQLRLQPAQVPALLDEIEAHRDAHRQALEVAAAATEHERRRVDDAADEDVERHQRTLAILQAVRDQVAPGGHGPRLVAGPAPLVSALVEGAARGAAEALLERAGAGRWLSREAAGRLLDAARVALAWAETLADVRELEWFTFEEG
jgi:hypothetical protein